MVGEGESRAQETGGETEDNETKHQRERVDKIKAKKVRKQAKKRGNSNNYWIIIVIKKLNLNVSIRIKPPCNEDSQSEGLGNQTTTCCELFTACKGR